MVEIVNFFGASIGWSRSGFKRKTLRKLNNYFITVHHRLIF